MTVDLNERLEKYQWVIEDDLLTDLRTVIEEHATLQASTLAAQVLDGVRKTRLAAFAETLAFEDQDLALTLRNLLSEVGLGPDGGTGMPDADKDRLMRPSALVDMLRLTGDADDAYGVTAAEITKTWTVEERTEVEQWAKAACLHHNQSQRTEIPPRIRNRYCAFVARQLEGAPKDV